MQLKKRSQLRKSLAIATCSLLANIPQQSQAVDKWEFDATVLNYSEKDRIKVQEEDFTLTYRFNDDYLLTGQIIIDSITGSTPTGALSPVATQTQALTTASGTNTAVGVGAASGNFLKPLDDFVDRRLGISANIESTSGRVFKIKYGASISQEDDYSSFGGSGSIALDLNQKLTTLEAGIGLSYDLISPKSGPPPELGNVENQRFDFNDGEKLVVDKSLGITQIVNRRTVAKLTLTDGTIDGYQTDPYKLVTLIDKDTDEPAKYFYEKRPNTRARDSINLDFVHQPKAQDVINTSYRFYWDDWGIFAHTLDFRYRWEFATIHYLQPHLRYYRQSAADFYVAFLDEAKNEDPDKGTNFGSNAPEYASADPRLDKLSTLTFGLNYGVSGKLGHFRIRTELLQQRGTTGEFKDLDAKLIQLTYTLKLK